MMDEPVSVMNANLDFLAAGTITSIAIASRNVQTDFDQYRMECFVSSFNIYSCIYNRTKTTSKIFVYLLKKFVQYCRYDFLNQTKKLAKWQINVETI